MTINKRLTFAVCLTLLSIAPLVAQPSSTDQNVKLQSIPESARTLMNNTLWVRGIKFNPNPTRGFISADVQLQNAAAQAITAYKCQLLITFDDGSQATQDLTEDVLPSLTEARIASSAPGRTRPGSRGDLFAGQTYTTLTSVRLRANGARPVSATGSIEMILYEDGLAVGDASTARMILSSRRQRSADMAATIAELQGILADKEMMLAASNPDINEPNGTRRRALNQRLAARIEQLKQSPGTSGEVRELMHFQDTLTNGGFITNGTNGCWKATKKHSALLRRDQIKRELPNETTPHLTHP